MLLILFIYVSYKPPIVYLQKRHTHIYIVRWDGLSYIAISNCIIVPTGAVIVHECVKLVLYIYIFLKTHTYIYKHFFCVVVDVRWCDYS